MKASGDVVGDESPNRKLPDNLVENHPSQLHAVSNHTCHARRWAADVIPRKPDSGNDRSRDNKR